jgi:protein required for attachment to host cells
MKPMRTWILIADGARARILENDGPGRGLQPVQGGDFRGEHAPTRDIVSDRPGREFQSMGAARSAIESHSDPHRELKRRFAERLADVLSRGLEQKAYERLVVVAAPVTLGDLRAALPGGVQAKVVGELAKDLTKVPDAQVAEHLKDVIAL